MSSAPDLEPLARQLDTQAQACASLGSPLYAELLHRAAADLRAGGVVADVLAGYRDDPVGSALSLRLLAAVHRQVLLRKAPRVALHYPSVGGAAGTDGAWEAVRELLASMPDQIRADTALPCQTNEPGRAAALLTGLLHVADRQPGRAIRLLEIGASAGLNLHVDRMRIGAFGPADGPVLLENPWETSPPPAADFTIAERAGCDVSPIDPRTPPGRLALSASVWADQTQRFHRLSVALDVAARHPYEVTRASAASWLAGRLAAPADGGATVVWHSIMWQYLSPAERTAVKDVLAAAGERATSDHPLVRVRLEPERRGKALAVALRSTWWPGGIEEHLADASAHGPPVRWLAR